MVRPCLVHLIIGGGIEQGLVSPIGSRIDLGAAGQDYIRQEKHIQIQPTVVVFLYGGRFGAASKYNIHDTGIMNVTQTRDACVV